MPLFWGGPGFSQFSGETNGERTAFPCEISRGVAGRRRALHRPGPGPGVSASPRSGRRASALRRPGGSPGWRPRRERGGHGAVRTAGLCSKVVGDLGPRLPRIDLAAGTSFCAGPWSCRGLSLQGRGETRWPRSAQFCILRARRPKAPATGPPRAEPAPAPGWRSSGGSYTVSAAPGPGSKRRVSRAQQVRRARAAGAPRRGLRGRERRRRRRGEDRGSAFSEKEVESSAKPLGLMRCAQDAGSMPGLGGAGGGEGGGSRAMPPPPAREASSRPFGEMDFRDLRNKFKPKGAKPGCADAAVRRGAGAPSDSGKGARARARAGAAEGARSPGGDVEAERTWPKAPGRAARSAGPALSGPSVPGAGWSRCEPGGGRACAGRTEGPPTQAEARPGTHSELTASACRQACLPAAETR